MPTWPVTLPQDQLLEGLAYAAADQTIRSRPDTGPTMTRRRYSTSVAEIPVPVLFTGAELAIFDTFYDTTLAGGSLTWTWTNPATGTTCTYIFLERPAFTPINGGTASARLWRAVMRLEKQV